MISSIGRSAFSVAGRSASTLQLPKVFLEPSDAEAKITKKASMLSHGRFVIDRGNGCKIPVHIYLPPTIDEKKSQVTLLLPGNRMHPEGYSFLAKTLTERGHVVASIGLVFSKNQELPEAVSERLPFWQEGSEILVHTINAFARGFFLQTAVGDGVLLRPSRIHAIGHSNGGDVLAYCLRENPILRFVLGKKVFLDSLRVPVPAEKETLIILAKDRNQPQNDLYILPTAEQEVEHGITTYFSSASHNHLTDFGSVSMKNVIGSVVVEHFSKE